MLDWFGPTWIWVVVAAVSLYGLARRFQTKRTRAPTPASEKGPAPMRGHPDGDPPEPVEIPIEESLDLHSFSPREILDVTDEYLRQAWEAGFAEVRLIHGRGTGFQRDRVRRFLSTHPLVSRYGDAPPGRGGWGATLVWLAGAVEDGSGPPRQAPGDG